VIAPVFLSSPAKARLAVLLVPERQAFGMVLAAAEGDFQDAIGPVQPDAFGMLRRIVRPAAPAVERAGAAEAGRRTGKDEEVLAAALQVADAEAFHRQQPLHRIALDVEAA
jgi:hypothetical protein